MSLAMTTSTRGFMAVASWMEPRRRNRVRLPGENDVLCDVRFVIATPLGRVIVEGVEGRVAIEAVAGQHARRAVQRWTGIQLHQDRGQPRVAQQPSRALEHQVL